jgi:hypothetical protein
VAFLNTRLDGDACNAAHIHAVRCASHGYSPGEDGPHYAPWRCDCGVPARVLADVQAKRAILAEHERRSKLIADGYYDDYAELVDLNWLISLLAQPYADHPGFDPAWRIDTAGHV